MKKGINRLLLNRNWTKPIRISWLVYLKSIKLGQTKDYVKSFKESEIFKNKIKLIILE